MEIIIKGEPKEIAALALELQGRQSTEKILLDGSIIAETIGDKESPLDVVAAAVRSSLSHSSHDTPEESKEKTIVRFVAGQEMQIDSKQDTKQSDYYKCGLRKWSKTPLPSRFYIIVSLAAVIMGMIAQFKNT